MSQDRKKYFDYPLELSRHVKIPRSACKNFTWKELSRKARKKKLYYRLSVHVPRLLVGETSEDSLKRFKMAKNDAKESLKFRFFCLSQVSRIKKLEKSTVAKFTYIKNDLGKESMMMNLTYGRVTQITAWDEDDNETEYSLDFESFEE